MLQEIGYWQRLLRLNAWHAHPPGYIRVFEWHGEWDVTSAELSPAKRANTAQTGQETLFIVYQL